MDIFAQYLRFQASLCLRSGIPSTEIANHDFDLMQKNDNERFMLGKHLNESFPAMICNALWTTDKSQTSGAVWKSRWPSWAPVPNKPYGFCGHKATLNQLSCLKGRAHGLYHLQLNWTELYRSQQTVSWVTLTLTEKENKLTRSTQSFREWAGIAQWLERRTRDRKGHRFESLQERRENFLLQGRLSVLTLISVSVPPPCYRSST